MNSDSIRLYKLNGMPPSVQFSIVITNIFEVEAYRGTKRITTRDLIDNYQHTLNNTCHVDAIIQRLETLPQDIHFELISTAEHLLSLCDGSDEQREQKVSFLGRQLLLHDTRRFSSVDNKVALTIYLRNHCTYLALRETLILPCKNTLQSYFWETWRPWKLRRMHGYHSRSIGGNG